MTWPICCLKLSGVHGHLSYSITLIRSITVMSHEHEGVSNHRHLDSSSNNIFRPTTSETKVPNYWPSVGRHPSQRASDMMTSSNGNIFRVTGHLCGNSPVPGEFPAQRPVTRSFGVLFDLRLNKRLSKQSRGWWFETLSRPLWCHCNVRRMFPCHNIAMSNKVVRSRLKFRLHGVRLWLLTMILIIRNYLQFILENICDGYKLFLKIHKLYMYIWT